MDDDAPPPPLDYERKPVAPPPPHQDPWPRVARVLLLLAVLFALRGVAWCGCEGALGGGAGRRRERPARRRDNAARVRYNLAAMTPAAQVACLIPVAYVLGSVPFGLLVGKAKGKDPRMHGSGNIGATNVARVLGGKRWFFLVFVLDLLKSLVPMLVAGRLLRGTTPGAGEYALWIAVGLAAVAGHVFSLFLKFTGGKGVATSAGVVLGIWPYLTVPGLIAIGVFVVVFMVSRYVSLGSIVAAVSLPVLYVAIGLTRTPAWPVFGEQLPLLVAGVLVAGMIVVKHRTNIGRLLAGTESKFTTRRAPV